MFKSETTKKIVKEHYDQIARSACGCGCGSTSNDQIAQSIGYSQEEIGAVGGANLGLGCGNPLKDSAIQSGDTVVDLGSGAGMDCFLAAEKVGPSGRVIGVDMTETMIDKARHNAEQLGYTNVEFRLGDIEALPVDDASVDAVTSNCVINLAPDKAKVFAEAYRVLKPGGYLYLSDIVLLAELSPEQKQDENLLAGCVAGALLKDEYLRLLAEAGFSVRILSEDKDISKRQYQGIALASLKIEARK